MNLASEKIVENSNPIVATTAITHLYLENFRNYQTLSLNIEPQSAIIMGHNGAGKTSLLEAISMLLPGRGIKSASNEELKHNQLGNWLVSAKINNNGENHQIGTTLINANGKDKRIIKINGEALKNSATISQYLSMIWLTPQIEQSLLDSSSNRRKMLDRMVFNFDPIHADNILLYEKKVKERQQIFKMPRWDERWLDIIEHEIAELNFRITNSRIKIINVINDIITRLDVPFPKLILKLECELITYASPPIILDMLKKNRKIDHLSGKTRLGAHRADLLIYHQQLNRLLEYCSTGEQKSMVLSLILFQAFAKKERDGAAPIMLLDEVMTHLDEIRREQLIATLKELSTQIWITGVEADFWPKINFPSQFFEVKNASVMQKNNVT